MQSTLAFLQDQRNTMAFPNVLSWELPKIIGVFQTQERIFQFHLFLFLTPLKITLSVIILQFRLQFLRRRSRYVQDECLSVYGLVSFTWFSYRISEDDVLMIFL